ncbi:MAG: aldehyde dehydrogenase family protein [Erythrobacter sp.]|uniref:aldehyde dehydrogenase family protein n=1 Tax=Erythrobacter sp. TaxID=1042 RepID=UPI00260C0617|nr:aldehyde dehydrogenase family protein [Erythrobacter sp.]MDJ0977299.1 aldehyde dehydrogenase family protein [Erythrobacter sp.]
MDIYKSRIAGELRGGGATLENRNPSDLSDLIGVTHMADTNVLDDAVEAARNAQRAWAATSIWDRAHILDAAGNLVFERKQALGELLAREEGKTLAEGIGETARAGQLLKFFAGEALRLNGEVIDSVRPGVDVSITREPLGVVGAITPWNFPIAIPVWKLAPALAFGNAVVMKPASLTPATVDALAAILDEAGLPKGVFNLVQGNGQIGAELVGHDGIDAVTFTGSFGVGGKIIKACAKLRRKVQAEMGGKNPLLVLDDANIDNAVDCALNGAFFSTGQRCTASSRLIVTDGVHDAFIDKLITAMKSLQVGHALEKATQIGPVVSQSQLDSNLNSVARGAEDGAEVIGGERLNRDTEGFFQAPALLVGANNKMRTSREEIFGPVASVIRVADYDEGLATCNDTDFGLSAGICTTSLCAARDFQRNAEAGMVMVNLPTAGVDPHVPFGGRKGSSYGAREQGSYAREFFTQVKTAYVG